MPIKSMKVGIKGNPASFVEVKRNALPKKNPPPAPNRDPKIRPGKVISRLKHNVTLSYLGEGMVIPAQGRYLVNDVQKLGAIPSGVTVVPVPMKK